MRSGCALCCLLGLALGPLSRPALGQTPAPPSGEDAVRPANASGTDLNYTPPATLLPELEGGPVSPWPHGLWRQFKFDYTWLPAFGNNGVQMNDWELSATAEVPFGAGWAPLLLTPGLAAHVWDGPKVGRPPATPDLPTSLYDAYVEFGWRPRLAPWLFTDFAVTPGIYSDFNHIESEAFQMRGRGLAIVAFSAQCQVVGGLLYVNRNQVKVLPAGGVVWNPDDDTKLNFLFPQPKFARRLATCGDIQWWAYLAGEFGGGRWSVERADGGDDSLDYSDIRVLVGLEWIAAHGLTGHVAVGYVFDRKVTFTSGAPDYKPDSTVLLRAGFTF